MIGSFLRHLWAAAEQQDVGDAVLAQSVLAGQGLLGADEQAVCQRCEHVEIVLGQAVAHAQLGCVADGRLQQLLLLGRHVRADGTCWPRPPARRGRGRPLVHRQLHLLAPQQLIHPARVVTPCNISAAVCVVY